MQPNIVYIHSHDTGRYTSPYGFAVDTPHIQRFAEQGVVFRQCFTVNPTCSPSRAALATGSYPHQNGMIGLTHRGARLRDPSQHVACTLRDAGYHTAIAGFQHVAPRDAESTAAIGYTQACQLERGNNGDAATVENALAVIAAAGATTDQPFFLDVGFQKTHRAGKPGAQGQWHNGDESPLGDPRYVLPPLPLPDTPTTRRDFADFAVCVNRLDAEIGRVIAAIDEAGLAESTLVIITTDHGIAFPHMKCNLTDHGMGVQLIMRGPGSFDGGRVLDAMVTQLDLFPTLCELADTPKPEWLQGSSLLPLVRGETHRLHDAVYGQVNYHASYEPMRCIRTDRYRYIRRWALLPHPVLANFDHSPSKLELMDAYDWNSRPQAEETLYDLAFDPHEAANLADSPAHAPILADLRARLTAWMEATADPLLTGAIHPSPPYTTTTRHGDQPGAAQSELTHAPE